MLRSSKQNSSAVLFLFIFASGLYRTYVLMGYIFVTDGDKSFTCTSSDSVAHSNTCPTNELEQCDSVTFKSGEDSSFLTEFSLVCDHSWMKGLYMSSLYAGNVLGGVLIFLLPTQLDDRTVIFLTLAFSVVAQSVKYCVTIVSSDFWTIIAMNICIGVCSMMQYITILSYISTMYGSGKRQGMWFYLYGFSYSVGIAILALSSYLVHKWEFGWVNTEVVPLVMTGLALLLSVALPPSTKRKDSSEIRYSKIEKIGGGGGSSNDWDILVMAIVLCCTSLVYFVLVLGFIEVLPDNLGFTNKQYILSGISVLAYILSLMTLRNFGAHFDAKAVNSLFGIIGFLSLIITFFIPLFPEESGIGDVALGLSVGIGKMCATIIFMTQLWMLFDLCGKRGHGVNNMRKIGPILGISLLLSICAPYITIEQFNNSYWHLGACSIYMGAQIIFTSSIGV